MYWVHYSTILRNKRFTVSDKYQNVLSTHRRVRFSYPRWIPLRSARTIFSHLGTIGRTYSWAFLYRLFRKRVSPFPCLLQNLTAGPLYSARFYRVPPIFWPWYPTRLYYASRRLPPYKRDLSASFTRRFSLRRGFHHC